MRQMPEKRRKSHELQLRRSARVSRDPFLGSEEGRTQKAGFTARRMYQGDLSVESAC